MAYKTKARNATDRNLKKTASKSGVSRNTTSRKQISSSSNHTYKRNTVKNNTARNQRRISNSKKYIKKPIPRKTKSPKINRNVSPAMKPKQIDYAILFIVLMLVIFGIVIIFSASYYSAMVTLSKSTNGDKFYFLKKQATWAVLGLCSMMFMTFFDYRKLKKLAIPAYIGANLLLILVLIIGTVSKGSKRWIAGFQPSEVAKLSTVLFMAYFIDQNPKILSTYKGFIQCMVFVGIPAVLVATQNLSTGIVIASVGCLIIFISGGKITHFLSMIIPAGGLGAILLFAEDYRLDRIRAWLDPFSYAQGIGYQIVQSLYAVASGGLFGKGLGKSIQKLGFIPEAHNDIIFSIVCEELGLVGAAALILLFSILISRGIRTSLRAKDLFASLVSSGVTCIVAVQVIINVAVVTNTIPTTGMPLPFISYGGSSLLVLMTSMGILLNISCYIKS